MKPLLLLLALFASASSAFGEPFILLFQSYDGDPAKPEQMSFAVKTVSLRQPQQFLVLGETIPRTQVKLVKFEVKTGLGAKGEKVDLSALTVTNVKTNESAVLVLAKPQDIPSAAK